MMVKVPCNFQPRVYQIPFLDAMDSGIRRAVLIWHRRSGKTKTLLNFAVKKAFERIGAYYHCFPEYNQGRKIIWDGIDKDGNKLIEHHVPPHIRRLTNKTEMKIELINNSIYQIVGADNYDSLVGPNPIGIIFDEWAVSPRYPIAWDYFRPILVENNGWAVFPYTPRGRNHGWLLYQMSQKNPDWFWQNLTVDDTGAISKEEIQKEREAGMSEDMIQQEFYCSFLAATENILIPFSLIQMAQHRDVQFVRAPRYAGGDCARYGDDRSTLVIRQGRQIIHAEVWRGLNNVQLAGRFIDRHRAKFYDAIAIDTIGMPGVYDLVQGAGVPCVPVNVSESPAQNPDRFRKLRDELWWTVREYFQQEDCSISAGIPREMISALFADIQDIHYEYRPVTGKIVIESKERMKQRLGFSPDLGDALCYTFAPGLEFKAKEIGGFPKFAPPMEIYNPLTFGL